MFYLEGEERKSMKGTIDRLRVSYFKPFYQFISIFSKLLFDVFESQSGNELDMSL